MLIKRFTDRSEAGLFLAEKLKDYKGKPDVIVLALPRGGVPVGYEVAKMLSVPLDVLIVRKLGVPGQEELAMGAVASGGEAVFNKDVIAMLQIKKSDIEAVIEAERVELKRRELAYRGAHPFPKLENKTIILVDDGIATGATMRAAIQSLKKQNPAKLIVATPVGETQVCQQMASMVDEVICLLTPEFFSSVGQWYQAFPQTTDKEVSTCLLKAKKAT